jgi:hypothetical protein
LIFQELCSTEDLQKANHPGTVVATMPSTPPKNDRYSTDHRNSGQTSPSYLNPTQASLAKAVQPKSIRRQPLRALQLPVNPTVPKRFSSKQIATIQTEQPVQGEHEFSDGKEPQDPESEGKESVGLIEKVVNFWQPSQPSRKKGELIYDTKVIEDRDRYREQRNKLLRERDIWIAERKRMIANEQQLEQELKELDQQNHMVEEGLRQFQVASFQELSTKRSLAPLEDQTIQQFLKEIHSDIDLWSRTNGVISFNHMLMLNDSEAASFVHLVRDVTLAEVELPRLQIQWWAEVPSSRRDPRKLLAAIVSHRLYQDLFLNPFSLIDSVATPNEPTLSSDLVDSYRVLEDGKFKSFATCWISC